jgi:hypothetical protein
VNLAQHLDSPPATVTPVPVTSTHIVPDVTSTPQDTKTIPSTTPTPQAIDPTPPPGQAWNMWAVTALATFAAFTIGFLIAVIWYRRKNR